MSTGANKKTKGRQMIAMKEIEGEEEKLVTFSKRRSGVFKKANELSTMCGAELAALVFSPAGKAYTFGSPSVESVVNRYLNQTPPSNDNVEAILEAERRVRVNELTRQYNELQSILDAEKRREKVIGQLTAGQGEGPHGWWDTPTDQANLNELNNLYSSFANLQTAIYSELNAMEKGEASSSMSAPAASTHNHDQQALPAFPPTVADGHDQHALPTNIANDDDELAAFANDLDPLVDLPKLPPSSFGGNGPPQPF